MKNNEDFYMFVINQICIIIKDNLQLFLLNDNKLKKLKKHYKNNYNDKVTKDIPYDLIIEFTHEALIDLLSSEYLFDYRDM